MIIRRLYEEDATDFRAIRLAALQSDPNSFAASYEEEVSLDVAIFVEQLRSATVFGAFDSDESLKGIVGVAKGQSKRSKHIANIWGIYVLPIARGTGVSKQLLKIACSHAFDESISIRLSVILPNERAQRFYSRFGFVEWAIERGALFVDGSLVDKLHMRLDVERRNT